MNIKGLNRIVKKVYNFIIYVSEIICAVILFTMIILLTVGVFYRYVLLSSRVWIPELSRYLLVALSMFGAVIALDRDRHVSVSFLYERMSINVRKVLDIGKFIIIGYYSYILIKHGLTFAEAGGGTGRFIRIPTFYPRVTLPIGGILFVVVLVKKVTQFLAAKTA